MNEFMRMLFYPYIRILFSWNQIAWGKSWKIYGVPIIHKHRGSTIQIGSNLALRSTVRSNPLGTNHPVILCTWQAGAILEVGDNFGMTGGSLVAAEKITRNMPKPNQQAGYPRKYGQGSLKAQVDVKNFIALKYPENKSPARPKKNIVLA